MHRGPGLLNVLVVIGGLCLTGQAAPPPSQAGAANSDAPDTRPAAAPTPDAAEAAPDAPAPTQAAPPNADAEDDAAAAPSPRDPFRTTPRMRDEARRRRPVAGRDRARAPVPAVTLRGYIEGAAEPTDQTQTESQNDEPTERPNGRQFALLEVEGAGVILVRPGERMSLPGPGETLTLRVLEMTGRSVVIQFDPIQERMTLR